MDTQNINPAVIAGSLKLPVQGVQRTVELLDAGNTVPFIARYRKDQTDGLDGDQIRGIQQLLAKQRQLEHRRSSIIRTIRSQSKLTEELKQQLEQANTLRRLEDLYLPFKPKKKSLSQAAATRGLGILAKEILSGDKAATDLTSRAQAFVDPDKELHSVNDVLLGACHIIAEQYSENASVRESLRQIVWKSGELVSTYLPPADGSQPAKPEGKGKSGKKGKKQNRKPKADQPAAEKKQVAPATETPEKPADTAETKAAEASAPEVTTPEAPSAAPSESLQAASPQVEPTAAEGALESPTENQQEDAAPTDDVKQSSEQEEAANEPEDNNPAEATPSDEDAAEAKEEKPAAADTTGESTPTPPVESAAKENAAAEEATPAATEPTESVEKAAPAASEPAADSATPESGDKPEIDFQPKQAEKPAPAPTKKSESKLSRAQQIKAAKKAAKHKKRQKLEQALREYFDFRAGLNTVKPHQILAINRGERFRVLRVRLEFNQDELQAEAEKGLLDEQHPHLDFLKTCVRDSLQRLILPSLEREVRRELTDRAEEHAIDVFGKNLRMLLLQPPVEGRAVLAIDPGFRSGCKMAAVDEYGNVLGFTIIHVIGREDRVKQGREEIVALIKKHELTAIAIGNGAASRETERLIASILANELKESEVSYVIVNEAGASVYSTSPLGREELPGFDPVLRSAVSIGRRLQDPLSELVKISPANIGVGLYQHDVKATHLQDTLDGVVEDCVNFVGVDVNSASPSLLRYVAGLNQLTARRIFERRIQQGPFRNREQLKEIPGLGDITWKQSAGFLRVNHGDNPLDATWIHPESYEVATRVLESMGLTPNDLPTPQPLATEAEQEFAAELLPTETPASDASAEPAAEPATEAAPETPTSEAEPTAEPSTESDPAAAEPTPVAEPAPTADAPAEPSQPKTETASADASAANRVAKPKVQEASDRLKQAVAEFNVDEAVEKLSVGRLLLQDILANLVRPGRDPREELTPPRFRREVMKIDDLTAGMEMVGTVLNVVDFGVFVDIGLSDSGLVHISRLANHFIKDPHEVVSVGDMITLWVESIDTDRRRVSLTAIEPGTATPAPSRGERKPRGRKPKPSGDRSSRPRSKGGKSADRTPRKNYTKPKKPRIVTPLTEEMKEGKAPMRSFSDLQQFFNKDKDDDKKKKKK